MPKWNIDRELSLLEPDSPGTTIQRATVDVKLLTNPDPSYRAQFGKHVLTDEEIQQGWVRMWCLSVGRDGCPKAFFYDRTIRKAFLRARKAAKEGLLEEVIGRQVAPKRKAKSRDQRGARSRIESPGSPPG